LGLVYIVISGSDERKKIIHYIETGMVK